MRIKKALCLMLVLVLGFLMACSKGGQADPTPVPYEGNTTMYQLPESTPNRLQMMSYVIQTKDNKIIVLDGGNEGDTEYFLDFLKDLTKVDKPHVDHWFLSHAHSDHTDVFTKVIEDDTVTISNVYHHFPPVEDVDRYERVEAHTIKRINAAFELIKDKTEIHEVQVGDRITIGSVEVEVLFVYMPEIKSGFLNNSSTVFRFHVEGTSILFLGDLGYEAGDILLQCYGDDLKSDIVQMAHHGSNGVRYNVYNKIAPKICLWPTPDWLWNNDQGKGYNTGPWETITLHKYMIKLGVETHYVSKDGLISIVFPLDETN
jgi:L-ascorbate metabolism protein UlaG (beta-lactamase superfamily)